MNRSKKKSGTRCFFEIGTGRFSEAQQTEQIDPITFCTLSVRLPISISQPGHLPPGQRYHLATILIIFHPAITQIGNVPRLRTMPASVKGRPAVPLSESPTKMK